MSNSFPASPVANRADAPLVFVTGASSGIGQALARHYARQGWRLALVARRVGVIETWARDEVLPAASWRAYAADVSDPDSIIAAAQRCLHEQGLPDVVIANAGISLGMDTADRDDLQTLRDTFATNNLGMAATFHPFLGPMRQQRKGTLVGVASVAAIRGLPGHAAYCASKAAVVSYCESLRGECRGTGVSVVTLLPGYVATPMTARNRFPMPFLLSAQDFAARAYRAIDRGDSYRVIPWQMAGVSWILRALPDALFDRLLAGRGRKRRRGE